MSDRYEFQFRGTHGEIGDNFVIATDYCSCIFYFTPYSDGERVLLCT